MKFSSGGGDGGWVDCDANLEVVRPCFGHVVTRCCVSRAKAVKDTAVVTMCFESVVILDAWRSRMVMILGMMEEGEMDGG